MARENEAVLGRDSLQGGLASSSSDPEVITGLLCPACDDTLRLGVSRLGGPTIYVHGRDEGGRGCRLVITPDPIGDLHRVELAPDEVRLEDMLSERIRSFDWSDHVFALIARGYLRSA